MTRPLIRKGAYFFHTHWLDSSKKEPLRCKITRIAQGTVYYRPHYGWHDDGSEWLGSASYFALDEVPRYVSAQSQPYAKHAKATA